MKGGHKLQAGSSTGSALILTVVLTSILAIVGVLFLMASRVETLSTSSLIDERDLNLAVDTIVSKLSNELVLDTPGVAGQEYYDYPGDNDPWLASIEPYDANGTYRWSQISDLTGYIRLRYDDPYSKYNNDWGKGPSPSGGAQTDVIVDAEGYDENGNNLPDYPWNRQFIPEYHKIALDQYGELYEQWADADGDGVADSKWIELEDIMGSRGQKVYAAIRVIDNAGMLNVNTAYEFDANSNDILRVDGSRLYQINLSPLGRSVDDDPDRLFSVRSNIGATPPSDSELEDYERYGAWMLADPCDDYTLFDISDELELRYRYLVSSPAIDRIESTWEDTLPYNDELGSGTGSFYVVSRPYDGNLAAWEKRVTDPYDTGYDRRHLLSMYNLDRIISADSNQSGPRAMINVNPDANSITDSFELAKKFYQKFSPCVKDSLPVIIRRRMKRKLAQLAVNLVDLRDRDNIVTSLDMRDLDADFDEEFVYGIEPFPVITNVAIRIDPNDPVNNPNYYAVELFNPFDESIDLDTTDSDFSVVITDFNNAFDPCDPNTFGARILYEFDLGATGGPAVLMPGDYIVLYNLPFFAVEPTAAVPFPEMKLSSGYRSVRDPNGGPDIVDGNFVDAHNVSVRRLVRVRSQTNPDTFRSIYVDRRLVYIPWVKWDPNGQSRFYGRDFDVGTADWWDVVYPQVTKFDANDPNAPALIILGTTNFGGQLNPRPNIDITMPYSPDRDLRTVGDISRIWSIGPTDLLYDPCDVLDFNDLIEFQLIANTPDPNDPNLFDPNDPNNYVLQKLVTYSLSVGERLLYASEQVRLKSGAGQKYEDTLRINYADPLYSNLFNYITVFDPRVDGIDNNGDGIIDNSTGTGEWKIPGRININTAPYFVIKQLPWMTSGIAESIVGYRDQRQNGGGPDYSDREGEARTDLKKYLLYNTLNYYDWDKPGFQSIGELNLVASGSEEYSIQRYALKLGDEWGFPDLDLSLTPSIRRTLRDEAVDDFEERDLVFARISNLVTVRSDVFTAYVLVRLGADGPQKRVMAVLDRSDVYKTTHKVKTVAVHDVSYPK